MLAEMIKYTKVADELIINTILSNEQIPAKVISLFSHVLNAQHIWAHRILGKQSLYTVWQEHAIGDFSSILLSNFELFQTIFEEVDLAKEIKYSKSNGETFANSVHDILFHVVNHSTYHRGQIASLLKTEAIYPPVSDYIILKREMQL